MTNTDLGLFAEMLSAQYLKEKGYEIITQNWQKKWGELDIVAKKDGVAVFVEVKAGMSEMEGFEPHLRANHEKLTKVARTARTFMTQHHYPSDQEWQIDVISVIIDKESKKAKFLHFKNVEI